MGAPQTVDLTPGQRRIAWHYKTSEQVRIDVPQDGDAFDACKLSCRGDSSCLARLAGYGLKR
jgi:hypothetical protein